MEEKTKKIVKALSTLFFQEGFDRETGKHGLGYWEVQSEDMANPCIRQCTINESTSLNTTRIDDKWYIRVFINCFDEYGDLEDRKTLLLIPVDTSRLCWEQFTKCAELIYLVYVCDESELD